MISGRVKELDGVRIIHITSPSSNQMKGKVLNKIVVLLRCGIVTTNFGLSNDSELLRAKLPPKKKSVTHLAKSRLEGLLSKPVLKRQKRAEAAAKTTAARTCMFYNEKQ